MRQPPSLQPITKPILQRVLKRAFNYGFKNEDPVKTVSLSKKDYRGKDRAEVVDKNGGVWIIDDPFIDINTQSVR